MPALHLGWWRSVSQRGEHEGRPQEDGAKPKVGPWDREEVALSPRRMLELLRPALVLASLAHAAPPA